MHERYRQTGRATTSGRALGTSTHDPVDVLACALWIVLDVLGVDDVRIDTWTRVRGTRVRTFDGADVPRTLTQILDRDADPVSDDATMPTASIRWADAADTTDGQPVAEMITLVARARDGVVDFEVTDLGLDREIAPTALADLVKLVVDELMANPDRPAGSVPLVTTEHRGWLVDELNRVRAPYPEAATIERLVLDVAAQTPDAIAIETDTEVVTYAALVGRARSVAATLDVAAMRVGEPVAVMFPRGVDCVAAMLGVLLAGGVYVPIALDEPEARRERMLDIVSVRLLLHADPSDGIALVTRDSGATVVPGRSDDTGSSPLYVMFTSGSTGDPKAVVVSHRAVIRLVLERSFVAFSPDDGVGFASNPGFDATTWEVWGALCNRARLVPISTDVAAQSGQLEALIRARGITCLFLTTSLFNSHARTAPAMFGELRVLGIGGEAADPSTCRRVLGSGSPPASLVNAYGPTESTTFASWHRITRVPDGALRLPIGLPIANTTLHVLDRRGRLVPQGVPGELFIGGDGLALGYLNDPDLTAQRFVPDPFAEPPARLYATGDLVVREPNGEVVFLRRLDDQLKIRGFRVEPVEIEAAIGAIDGVSSSIVVPMMVEGSPRLVAYVLADSPGLEPNRIRARLRTELPAHLVPSQVVVLDELPLTRNGKLDRARLPDPFAPPRWVDAPVPATETADDRLTGSIADVWREVLCLRDVDPDATFFDAGGDSLLAVRLYGAVQRRFGVVLPSGSIDQDVTITRFVEAVRAALNRAAPPMVTEMTTVGGPLVVLVAPGGGELDRYRWLVPALADRFHVVGVREPGQYGTEPRPRSMTDVSVACADALREARVGRPVVVVGECSGGVLAHQLAYDLGRNANRPDLVVLLDTPIPGIEADDKDGDGWSGLVSMARRRGTNAVALTRMQTQSAWYRMRNRPTPPALSHSLTVRNNARRVREAAPPFYAGHVLYVQAVDDEGATETDGAPEYWRDRADSVTVVTAPGAHTGPQSFLSRSNARITADAITQELAAVDEGTPR